MESLKPLSEVSEPDVRQKAFVTIDLADETMRPLTLEDFHRRATSIELHAGVPEAIRSHFETARNLIVYSWFFYPFNVTAELAAYTTVEFAVRSKFNDRKTHFQKLLKKAVDDGLIKDQGFSIPVQRVAAIREHNAEFPAEFQIPETTLLRQYSDTLARTIPFLRNQLAHGNAVLHNHGESTVRVCAEVINQLFPPPAIPPS
jgi:hypothetical protein